MQAFPIADRVSPSGPLASPFNSPTAQMAGKRLVYRDPGEDVISYPGKIGASGVAVISPTLTMYNGSAGLYVPPGNALALTPLGNDFGLTPGVWLVEADISVGFNTSPAAATVAGSLSLLAGVYTDAGVLVTAGAAIQSPIPRTTVVSGNETGVTHSTKLVAQITLSEGQYQANGLTPLRSMTFAFTREDTIDPNAGGVGLYTNTSGILEFTRDCSILVRRVG